MRILVGLLLLTILGACAGGAATAPDDKTLLWSNLQKFALATGRFKQIRAVDADVLRGYRFAESFRKIAFPLEQDPFLDGDSVNRGRAQILRRWVVPITYRVWALGDNHARAESEIDRFTGVLAGHTSHPITKQVETDDGSADARTDDPNLMIMMVPDIGFRLLSAQEGVPERFRNFVVRWLDSLSPCAGIVLGKGDRDGETGELAWGMVVIRQEVPDLLLRMCVEEELAQVMGLANDDESVKPSIFNDDQEFALLTDLDARMLQVLYDDRLKPGMSLSEAMPIVRRIAAEPLLQ